MTDAPRLDAFLASRHLEEAVEDLSAADINRMSMADYREIRRRAGLPDVDPFATAYAPAVPPVRQAPAPAQQPAPAPESQSLDPDSAEYFHAWRANRRSAGEGVGIFHSVSSQSDQYRAAVRAQAGRTALSNANVTEAPKLTGRYLDHDAQRDTRTAAQRFSTPGNAFS